MRILILEDDPLIALDLQDTVEAEGHTVVAVCASVAAARARLAEAIDFALLDVDLADGKSFAIAAALLCRGIPFAFVSGSEPSELPSDLASTTFIPKPFIAEAVVRTLPSERRAAA